MATRHLQNFMLAIAVESSPLYHLVPATLVELEATATPIVANHEVTSVMGTRESYYEGANLGYASRGIDMCLEVALGPRVNVCHIISTYKKSLILRKEQRRTHSAYTTRHARLVAQPDHSRSSAEELERPHP